MSWEQRLKRVFKQVRHNCDVPAGVDKTDTLSTRGLIYETKQTMLQS